MSVDHGPEPADPAGSDARAEAPAIRRVLVVVAHPDDETLTAGALLAELAAHCPVTLVTCTRGERGEVIGADLAHLADDPDALAEHRVGELRRALDALGIADHRFLDEVDGGPRLVDSGMRWDDDARLVRALPAADAGPDAFSVAPLERSVAALTAVLDDVRPDLVLVDEPEGGYGHPDHRRAHEVTMAAVARAAEPPPFVAWLVRPVSAVRVAQEWLRGRTDRPTTGETGALTVAEPDAPLPSIVVPDDAVDVQVDVTERLPALADAMRAHRSQVQAVHLVDPAEVTGPAAGWFALSNGLLQPVLRGAWLRVAPGWGDPAQLRDALGALLDGSEPERGEGAWYRPSMTAFSAVLGVAAGALGTAFHRVSPPWGMVTALLLVVAAGVLARTFVERAGQLAFAVATIAAVLVLTYVRPGGDLLVTGEPIGVAWIVGSMVAAAIGPALVPRRWMAER